MCSVAGRFRDGSIGRISPSRRHFGAGNKSLVAKQQSNCWLALLVGHVCVVQKGFGNACQPKEGSTSLLFRFGACKTLGGMWVPRESWTSLGPISEIGGGRQSGTAQSLVALLLPCWVNPEPPAIKPPLAEVICGDVLSLQ